MWVANENYYPWLGVCASLPLHGILPMGTEGSVSLAR